MSPRVRSILLLALPILLVTLSSYYLQGLVLKNEQVVATWLSSFGPFIVLAYVVLHAITIIIPPLGGFVLVVAMITLFGPGPALTLAYLVSTPMFLLNFYLAKRYGRPLVIRVVGREPLEKVDRYVQDAGISLLLILRLLQGGSFDYLSYGFGLTKINFRTFAMVNILAGIPGTLLNYLILREFENLTVGVIIFYLVTIILSGVAIYLTHFTKTHRRIYES
ncbi:MAG: VTT domain-containing protein [bacterium]|nr:VTT domain-containing protein [bacterium]